MNGRASGLLIAFVVCLAAAPALGRYATPADAASGAHGTITTGSQASHLSGTDSAQTDIAPAVASGFSRTGDEPGVTSGRPSSAGTRPAPALLNVSGAQSSGIAPEVLQLSVAAVTCAVNAGEIARPRTLTVIDYSLPSVEPRLWVFDVETGALLFKELVAHGRNTGENMSVHFSDTPESRQSSIGLFVARDTYVGSNGYSLRLDGLEPGFNGRARERAIVMHGAWYVDPMLAASQGRIGRSWGCPALREAIARDVIDTVRGGGVIFSYYPDQKWLASSRFLNCGRAPEAVATH